MISGAIPTPFDLAMLTYSSKLTKEYLLGSGGLWRFYLGGTKLARFCHKNECIKRMAWGLQKLGIILENKTAKNLKLAKDVIIKVVIENHFQTA